MALKPYQHLIDAPPRRASLRLKTVLADTIDTLSRLCQLHGALGGTAGHPVAERDLALWMPNSRIPKLTWFTIQTALFAALCFNPFSRQSNHVDSLPPDIQTIYYEVSGRTPAELVASIDQCRPTERDGQTDWYIKWRYWYEPQRGQYVITSFAADVEIRYSMPKWIGEDQVDSAVREEWQRYIDCLTVHESLHGQIAMDCADAMKQHFSSNVVGTKERQAIGKAVDSVCLRFIEEYAVKEVAYDKDTDHGRTQGALRDFSQLDHVHTTTENASAD